MRNINKITNADFIRAVAHDIHQIDNYRLQSLRQVDIKEIIESMERQAIDLLGTATVDTPTEIKIMPNVKLINKYAPTAHRKMPNGEIKTIGDRFRFSAKVSPKMKDMAIR